MDVTPMMPTPPTPPTPSAAKAAPREKPAEADAFDRILQGEARPKDQPALRRDAMESRTLEAAEEPDDEGLGGALALSGALSQPTLTAAAVASAMQGGQLGPGGVPAGLEALRQLAGGSLKELLAAALQKPVEGGTDSFAARLAQRITDGHGEPASDGGEGGDKTIDPVTLTEGDAGGEVIAELAGRSAASPPALGTSIVTEGAVAGPAAPPPVGLTAPTAPQAAAPAGHTPTMLPPGVEEAHVLRQISDGLRLSGDAAAKTAEITLDPPELGRVRLSMTMEDGAVRILVTTEHAGVKELLAQNLDRLRSDLLAHGVQTEQVEVRQESAGDRRSGGEDDEGVDSDVALREDAHPASTRGRRLRTHAGRIDVTA